MSGIVISGDTRGGVGGAPRKPAAAATAPGAFKAAVAGVLTKLQQGFNKADAKAVGALFGKEADYVNMAGGHITGADKIAQAHKQLFDGSKGMQTAYRVIKLKPLGADVVMAFLGQQMTFKGEGGKDQVVKARPTMVLRKAGADWKIAAFQVTRVGAAAAGGGKAAPSKAAPAAAAKAAPAKAAPAKKADKK